MINTCSPEEKGISSEYISDFYKALEYHHVPIHSVILYCDDSIISERYCAPYKKGDLHRLFSISKSVTALAIGMLSDSKKLSIDDKIISYFPDKVPSPCHPWLADMSIRDMLMMRTCHAQSTYNKFDPDSDWVGSFFTKIPTHKSGSIFHYDTSAAHVLAALVERITHMPLWNYVRSGLPELELSKDSYMLKDGHGVSMGGTGLVATPDDMLKLGILLLNNGKYNNKQLISEEYIIQATSNLTPNCVASPVPSEGSGYGYMIWRTERNGFVCYGMGGQLIIVQPEHRIILVTTSDTQGLAGMNQMIYNSFYSKILDKLSPVLSVNSSDIKYPAQNSQKNSDCNIFNRLFNKATADSKLSVSYTFYDGYGNPVSPSSGQIFTSMTLENCGTINGSSPSDQYLLTLFSGDKAYSFPFAIEYYAPSMLPDYNFKCYSYATLPDEQTLYIKTTIIDSSVGSIHFQICFGENDLVLYIKKIEETLLSEYAGHYYGVKNET